MIFTSIVIFIATAALQAPPDAPASEIRLIARADDMGAAQSINEGCIEAYASGIVRSVEVIVPGPWFPDAVRMLKENPDLDAGVHLTLTSEWDRVKWRPLTPAPSLVDKDGYFHATTQAFLAAKPSTDEIERELRAQIETARRHLGAQLTHISSHMNAATATPEIKAITEKLAKEYNLRTGNSAKRADPFGNAALTSDQRERALIELLEKLEPGDWILVEHPGYDTPESRGLGHAGYENVATDRSNVRRAFTSERVMRVIKRRGIKLISYRDL